MNLLEWLKRIQSLHVTDMDLSLERVQEVARRLNGLKPTGTVIIVGGTNGKGSCVAGLESIYRTAGYRVGTFTSPVLFRHNEYVRIQGVEPTDEEFCDAFTRIDKARNEITLTPFEFSALAAFDMFHQADLDVWILEVGLGGRYDAVNIMDADAAIVASIGIDHVDWLGDTREKIAFEKAGIFRSYRPAICGDFDPPHTLVDHANEIGTPLFCQNQEFGFEKKDSDWSWWSDKNRLDNLPLPKLALQNMSTVLMAVELLQDKLPVKKEAIQKALSSVTLPGRIEVLTGDITQIFDVSHNPAAAEFLATWLNENIIAGKTRAVFSMLADKDIVATLQVIKNHINDWHIAGLSTKRAATLEKLQIAFEKAEIDKVSSYDSIMDAYRNAMKISEAGDRVLVFGSFHTVSSIKGSCHVSNQKIKEET